VQRLYDFFRRHPAGVDSFWAVVLLGFSALWIVMGGARHDRPLSAVPLALALSTAVALRSRAPEKMLLLVAATGVAQVVLDVRVNPGDFAMLVIVYTVAAKGERWASRLALIGGLCAPAVAQLRWNEDYATNWQRVVATVFAELEERAARLEREREAQSRMAVAAERARIARELHDVVAHNMSVMVVQADGAAYVLDAAPDQARQALETISGTGRQALAEMRRLLGVLRTGEPSECGEYLPQPDVGQLDDLIDQVRGAGLPVDFTVLGTPHPLSSGVALTAYRIVQEALTNTRKHGGPDAGATVRLTYGDARLDLLVEDDGHGARRELCEEGGQDGLGHGLIGMRERVGMVGGSLDAGPRPGGGFRVSAVLPLKPAH
jgi:signal transduction histidine kinase